MPRIQASFSGSQPVQRRKKAIFEQSRLWLMLALDNPEFHQNPLYHDKPIDFRNHHIPLDPTPWVEAFRSYQGDVDFFGEFVCCAQATGRGIHLSQMGRNRVAFNMAAGYDFVTDPRIDIVLNDHVYTLNQRKVEVKVLATTVGEPTFYGPNNASYVESNVKDVTSAQRHTADVFLVYNVSPTLRRVWNGCLFAPYSCRVFTNDRFQNIFDTGVDVD